ncbi:NAM domain-containing protein, partial [Cephalotus follicularis]
LPAGYRFYPTDEELLFYYLYERKSKGCIKYSNIIRDLDVYNYPSEQLRNFAYDNGDNRMYFFASLNKKYENGLRANRRVPGGYWKASQKSQDVKDRYRNRGTKISLAYYMDNYNDDVQLHKDANGEKTNWLMKEYRL